MKLSPVQLLESKFLKIFVEFKDNPASDAESAGVGLELDIEHMTHIERHEAKEAGGGENTYVLALGIRSGADEKNLMPYSFELVVTGIISIDPKRLAPGLVPDDSAAKFGFTMLFGQIREALTTMTGRMNSGQFVLPTMSFMDATFDASAVENRITSADQSA